MRGLAGEELEPAGRGSWVDGAEFVDLVGDKGNEVGTDATETPLGVGHFADAAQLGEVARLEIFSEFEQGGFVLGGVVAGK